jgi:hypothetical protein
MKKILLLIFIFLFILSANTQNHKIPITIAVVASYPICNVITYKKMGALKFTLAGIENTSNFDYKISTYYIPNPPSANEAVYIQNFLGKIKYNYVIIMDDMAFNIMYKNGMINEKDKYIITGLSYVDKEMFNEKLKNYNIIYYIPNLTKLFNLIQKTNFVLDNLYIFTDTSPQSIVYLKTIMPQINNYVNALYTFKKPVVIQISNSRELKRELTKLNQNYKGLIISCLVNLINAEKNRFATKKEIVDIFTQYNVKHLEVFLNLDGIQYGGAIGVSPRRSELSILAINLILNYPEKGVQITPPSYLGINQNRLNDLRLDYIYNKGGDLIDIFY